jgi:predicted anti-sigma-YlaC factor YlaD
MCSDARAAISARLDNERLDVPSEVLDDHLAGCADCRSFERRAFTVTAEVRLAAAVDPPDRTAELLAAVHAARPGPAPAHTRRPTLSRLVLAAVALAQLVVAVPALAADGTEQVVHLSREMAAFDVALAVGFAWAARAASSTVARSLAPVVLSFLAVVLLTSAVGGSAAVLGLSEARHVLAVVGAAALWALSRGASSPTHRAPAS